MPADRYFMAIVLPAEPLADAESVKQMLLDQHGLKGGLRSPAHITLHRPFQWEREKEASLIEKLNAFPAPEAFSIALDGFAAFAPRVIYIKVSPSPQLEELHAQLSRFARRALKLFNESDDMRGFHPHVTVANRDLKPALFHSIMPAFAEREFRSRFDYPGTSLLRLDTKWKEIHRFAV